MMYVICSLGWGLTDTSSPDKKISHALARTETGYRAGLKDFYMTREEAEEAWRMYCIARSFNSGYQMRQHGYGIFEFNPADASPPNLSRSDE